MNASLSFTSLPPSPGPVGDEDHYCPRKNFWLIYTYTNSAGKLVHRQESWRCNRPVATRAPSITA